MSGHVGPHASAKQTVRVSFANAPHFQLQDPSGTYDFLVEDYWDRLTGGSWMDAEGNPAAIIYAIRIAASPGIPVDDEVLYGHIGHFGHLVHVSEVVS